MHAKDRPPGPANHAANRGSTPRHWIAGFLFSLLATLLSACGGGNSAAPAATPMPAASSAVIGPAGGTLTGPDGVQVIFPAGALNADTTIGIARSSAGAPATFADNPPAGGIYEFTPHNLVFNTPVTIRMPLPANADPAALFMASPGEDWQNIGATVTAGIAEWTRNSFSWGMAGLFCTATATLADLYPCIYPSGGANASATPATAITRTAFGSLGLYSGNAGSWNVTEAGTVNLMLHYSAAADCQNAAVKLIRWNPAVPVTPANPATIVFQQPVALTSTVFSLPGGTFACSGTTNLDGTPCGSFRRGVGNTTVAVPFSHLDKNINPTGTHAFGYSFSCNRPGKPKNVGGDLMTFKVSIPTPTVTFSLGGSVSGLTGAGLVLSNPGSSNLLVAANGGFTFSPLVGAGTPYAVAVLTQPSGQTCTVTNGTGTASANVTNVAVTCVPSFNIGGTVSGLAGTGLMLQNNGSDNLAFTTSGPFSFLTRLVSGSAYNVTILSQPSGSTCSVANGSGTAMADVTNVAVTCVSSGPLVLVANSGVTNGNNALSVYRANPSTGALSFLSNVNAGDTPWAFAQLPNHSVAYVTNAVGGTVQAFNVNNTTGAVTLIPLSSPQSLNSFGIAMDRLGRFLWTANYGFSTVQTFAINGSGVLASSPPVSTPNSLPYAIAAHPTMDFVYTAHQSSNFALMAFSVNTSTGALTQVQSLTNAITSVNALVIDPTGRFAYAVSGSGGVCAWRINSTTGILSSSGCANTASSGGTWSVAVHPNGQFLYTTSDTASNNVSIFSINQTTGALTLSGSPATAGNNARGTTVDSTGNYLYVTNYVSNTISAFSIGGSGSSLTSLGAAIPTGLNPVGVIVIP